MKKDLLLLSLAGFLATAVTYGPARMGFGLFLPEFREEFALSTEVAGFIASAAFFGFLLALPLASRLTSLVGPRVPVVTGGILASSGMALVSVSMNVAMLATGMIMAASSAGFCWTPYNNAVARNVPEDHRPHVLSAISTGTTVGVAGAGLLAILMVFYGVTWRAAWGAFAVGGLIMTGINLRVLRGPEDSSGPVSADVSGGRSGPGLRYLLQAGSLPLFAAALSFGATSAIYLSFAADRIAATGGIRGLSAQSSAPVIFIAYGLVGIVGLVAGRIEQRVGLVFLLKGIFLCSALSRVLVALLPDSLSAVLISAGLQGGCVMTISAIFAFWSLRLFPQHPSVGFTATILAVATGSVVGPALAGIISSHFGADVTFLSAGGLSLVTALVLGPKYIRPQGGPS